MTKEVRKPRFVEVGHKSYYNIDEICEYLEMDKIDAYIFLFNNGYRDWCVTETGDVLTDSMGYRALMINKDDKDKYSYLIKEMEFIREEERIEEEVSELLNKRREIDKKIENLSEQQDELERKWSDLKNLVS